MKGILTRNLANFAFGLALLIVLILSGLIYNNLRDLLENNQKVSQTVVVLQRLDETLALLTDAETASRGYVITGEDRFLEPYNAALSSSNSIQQRLQELRQLTGDNPNQQARLDLLDSLAAQKLAFIQQIIDLRKREGFEAAQKAVSTESGKRIMDDIRRVIADMKDEERGLLQQRSEASAGSSQRTTLAMTIGVALSMFLLLGAFIIINRQMDALRRAEEALQQLNNELEQRVEQRTAALAASERDFRDLADNALIGIYRSTVKGEIKYANQTLARMMGFDSPEDLIREGALMRHRDPADRQAIIQKLQRDGKVESYELVVLNKSGEPRNVLLSARIDGDQLTSTILDITERKRAEEKLNRLLDLLNLTARMARVGGWELDVESQTLTWSDEVYRIHEVDPSVKPNVTEAINFYAPESRPLISAAVQAGIESGTPWDLELELITAKGRRIWVRALGMAERKNGKTVRLFGAFQDITERKQAENQLRESNERFKRLVSQLNDVVWYANADGSAVLDVNQAFEKIYGISAKALSANPNLWIEVVHPDDRKIAQASAEELFKNGRAEAEYRIIRPDGTVRWLLDRKSLLYDETGKPVQMGGIATDITEQKKAEEEIQRQLQHLRALREIDLAIMGTTDVYLSLQTVLEHVLSELRVDAADFLVLNPYTQTLEYVAGRGFRKKGGSWLNLKLGQGMVGRAALEQKAVHISHLANAGNDFGRQSMVADEGFVAYYAVPLTSRGNLNGVLEIFHRQPLEFDSYSMDLLYSLAGQASIAIDNNRLFHRLLRSNQDLMLAYDTTIEGWSHALDLRDKETEGHTQRVTELTMRLAQAAGIAEGELAHIRRGALLHDIGKMGVPDYILLKPGKLTDEEWVEMRKHPVFAYELLSPIAYLKPALDIPYCHHEKWDGSGYPRGLKGEQIPLAARLFAIVDVWDALRSDRPYRQSWSKEKVIEHIKSLSGTHFDPKAVELFLDMMSADEKHAG